VRVDFHLHTTISDGVWTPSELFAYLRSTNVEVFSVTDHDTMDVYPVPGDLADRVIPGMEVDTKCNGVTAHLLVFGITDPKAPLLEHLRIQREARRSRMQEMLQRLHGMGIDVSMADVAAQAGTAASLGRPHLARALVAKGLVPDVQSAFDRYLADDQDGYVSLDRLESAAAIELAHASGAVVSVAHPCRLREPASLEVLRAAGVDGVEVVHPTADAAKKAALREYARAHGLLVTGGSDFHAPTPEGYAPGIELEADEVEAFRTAVTQRAAA
jgi:predicted metal-dependent phosphoesterase TrpH